MHVIKSCVISFIVFIAAFDSAQAALVSHSVDGTVVSAGSADVGTGLVSGFFTFDDDPLNDLSGGVGTEAIFELAELSLQFDNGPTITLTDDPLAQAVVDRGSQMVTELAVLATGLNGFGLTNVGFLTDIGALSFFFFDSDNNIVVTGNFTLTRDVPSPIPLPGTLIFLATGLMGLAAQRRRAVASYNVRPGGLEELRA